MREEGYGHGGSGNGGIGIAMRHARASPQTPTVGAGSSQREDSPALPHAHPMPCGFYNDAARRVATSSEKRENRL